FIWALAYEFAARIFLTPLPDPSALEPLPVGRRDADAPGTYAEPALHDDLPCGAVVSAAPTRFSFRAPAPPRPAAEVLAEIRERGGRVYRMRSSRAFCLTDDPQVAEWLLSIGATPFTPQNADEAIPPGAYKRARGGKVEFDLWVDTIPVTEER